jgi:eukaryotic-like serine/threonine-protein kinase
MDSSLMMGQTLAHYRIVERLAAGGMGEVYRASDTKLGREVAIKVLPDAFARDPERLARFEREARLLASLNHPNIAAIHGFEQSGDIPYLVLELVPGVTLAGRLAAGPLGVEEALRNCSQIAVALEAAHERGVIHRDLKPANIKITPEGKVKVLDFGLAKAFAVDLAESSAVTEVGTREGVILGTSSYMSPEQARGKPVDKRTDIWSFGCVLYEALTGRRAFTGDTVSDTIAAILEREPQWDSLPDATTVSIRLLLSRCLEKDRNRRLHDIADARIEIEDALAGRVTAGPTTGPTMRARAGWRLALPWGLAGLLLGAIAAGVAIWEMQPRSLPTPQPTARFVMALPATERLSSLDSPSLAISPDGTHLAYVVRSEGSEQLYLRAMDQFESRPIPGTEDAYSPFFSPDGQWIGFFSARKLKKVSTKGGPPLTLCDAFASSASWGADDTIVIGDASGLLRVSAAGGEPQAITTLDSSKGEIGHDWPEILPGGKAVIFTLSTSDQHVVVQSLETRSRQVLVQGSYARYVPTGHLVYIRAGRLLAVSFDLARLKVTGDPVPVVEDVLVTPNFGLAQFCFSSLGLLVYIPGGIEGAERRLVWVDRKGMVKPWVGSPRAYWFPRLSPDGRRLSVQIGSVNSDVWTYDLRGETPTRLTFKADNNLPIWTPDGKRLTFASNKLGAMNLFWKAADGSASEERLTTSEHPQLPCSWSPDGEMLAFEEIHPRTGSDLWILPLKGERKPRPFLQTQSDEEDAAFSPDGRWLAYASNESGRYEIYIQPLSGPGGKRQISTEGGTAPLWARNWRELFYLNGDKMMAVEITIHPTFTVGKRRLLFEGRYQKVGPRANYDVTPDGQRFVMVQARERELAPAQLNVVTNWFEDLKRRVGSAKP